MRKEKDIYNKDVLVDDTKFQVMMEWEKPYMEALVENLSPQGDVLEIGFGLGYSANKILSYPIRSYTVIESDPDIIQNVLEWAPKQNVPVRVVEGPWQETLNYLGTFDSVFFDDSPHREHPDKDNIRLYKFYYSILRKHVNINCRMTAYMDQAVHWISHPLTTWENKFFYTEIPNNVEYIDNKNKNFLCMPVISFPYGIVPNAKSLIINKNLQLIGEK